MMWILTIYLPNKSYKSLREIMILEKILVRAKVKMMTLTGFLTKMISILMTLNLMSLLIRRVRL